MQIFESWRLENLPEVSESKAFEIFSSELVLRPYGLGSEEIISGIVGGGQDGAIDSIYTFFDDSLLDEDSDVVSEISRAASFSQERPLELWIIQAKRTPGFSEEAIDKLENTLRRLLDLSEPEESLGLLYGAGLLNRIGLFRTAWYKLITRRPKIKVSVLYATPGDRRNVTPQVEAKLNSLRHVITSLIPAAAHVEVDLWGATELLQSYNERPSYALPMQYRESATSGRSHVALVTLKDYYDLIVDENGRLRRYLFEWNVRDYQGAVSVNQDIRKSLEQSHGPDFWWLNNGVTILCKEATSAGKTYSLSDIQIVNGLQTSHEIYEAVRSGRAVDIDDRMLLIRIIVTENTDTRDHVIKATNRQTTVTDAALRATDEVQRNIENYFLTEGWYYDRRKNFYKNEGKDTSKIVGIPMLGAALTAMGLARPDKARGKPSSLLKNDEDYKQVFSSKIDLEIYFWAAKMQRKVDAFIISDIAEANTSQKSNLKYHLSMLIVEKLNGSPVRAPGQLKELALRDASMDNNEIKSIFEKLKGWSDEYLTENQVILERATKSQKFSDYLLSRAANLRAS
ncbi:AIPR family protein [Allonocardiopsis opalescens]|nr:AIPR family protein [Allonocardiopsis opalescens]